MTPAGRRRRTRWRAALAIVTLVFTIALMGLVTGCGKAQKAPVTAAERSQALIESGNQAFKAGNYGLAARRYAAAAVVKDDDPAAYYGLGMALAKLGRDEDARAAYARARALAQAQANGSN